MGNVIANAFAFRENYGNSMQLEGRKDDRKLRAYMSDIVVSLVSARRKNPEDTVVLVTNRDLPEDFVKRLQREEIEVLSVPFDAYVMPKDFPWALAFYKICALEYLAAKEGVERILLMDTDTYTTESYASLWKEADHGLMLFGLGHSYDHPDRAQIRKDYRSLYPEEKRNIVHYGGEFLCARQEDLADYLKICRSVYERMKEKAFSVDKKSGDELILSIAAAIYKESHPVTEATAYIYRYWTEDHFYLVSTNTESNPVCIWHLPEEKDKGLLLLYRYYDKHNAFPKKEKACRYLGLIRAKRPYPLMSLYARWIRKRMGEKR